MPPILLYAIEPWPLSLDGDSSRPPSACLWLRAMGADAPARRLRALRTCQRPRPLVLGIFRGCRVKSIGTIGISPTGYYSLDTFQEVEKIEPVGACPAQPSLFDHSEAKPNQAIHAYRVDMHVIYRSGDHPIVFHVWSAGKERRPWQAYASYMLTGGFVLYGHCGNGFVVDTVFGTPEAHPGHFDEPRTPSDMASFDPESAAQAGKRDLHLGYTCIRATQTDRSSIQ